MKELHHLIKPSRLGSLLSDNLLQKAFSRSEYFAVLRLYKFRYFATFKSLVIYAIEIIEFVGKKITD